jgi:hypothetical protein
MRPIYPQNSSSSSREQGTTLSPKGGSSLSSIHYQTSQPGVFAQGGMTESPKPLSPGQTDQQHHRIGMGQSAPLPGGRSPSMSQHILSQQYALGAGRDSSPLGLPPPSNSNAPQLPQLPGLGPGINMSSKAGANKVGVGPGHPPSMLHQQVPGPTVNSNPGSHSSHGASSGGSMREIIGNDIWGYVRQIEERAARKEEEYEARIRQLENELSTVKAQLPSQTVAPPPPAQLPQQPPSAR